MLKEISIWEKIDKTYEIVSSNDANNFIKYMPLFVAFISFVGVIAQLYLSYQTNKKNLAFQEKWEKKKLDADLISKARIEWLKESRILASELFSLSFKAFKSANMVARTRVLIINNKDKYDTTDAIESLRSYEKDLNYSRAEAMRVLNLFHLMFGIKDSNNEIIDVSSKLYNFVEEVNNTVIDDIWKTDLEEYQTLVEEKAMEGSDYLDKFTEVCRVYFDIVWQTSKKGE